MRIRYIPSTPQRIALRARLERLLRSENALELLRPTLPVDFVPDTASCAVRSSHPDRFVLQVVVRSHSGEELAYAVKAYSDDFGERVWEYAQTLSEHQQAWGSRPCLPMCYIADERVLVFPWISGRFLTEIADHRKPALLRRAALLAAELHRLPVVPERLTSAQTLMAEARTRYDRARETCPEAAPHMKPLLHTLQQAVIALDPADPAPVHGDLAAGQYLWTGRRLILLDLDMFGYTDPAYDAGHFLAQLERRCLADATPPGQARRWISCFQDAYLEAMPAVSARNVSFYRSLTLVRKMYSVRRQQPEDWLPLVHRMARRARAALRHGGFEVGVT